MRDRIWRLATSRQSEGCFLPGWLIAIRFVLYPLDSMYWRMSESRGYQWQDDSWIVDGVKLSRGSVRFLTKSDGRVFRIKSDGKSIELELLEAE